MIKNLILILFCSLLSKAIWSEVPDWCFASSYEDEEYKYYIGISDGEKTITEARKMAFNDALRTAIIENFSLSHNYSSSSKGDMENNSYHEETSAVLKEISISEVNTKRIFYEKSSTDNERYFACREIKIKKTAILKEQNRQINIKLTLESNIKKIENKNEQINGHIKITSNCQGAIIYIINTETKQSFTTSIPADFYLPLGEYEYHLANDYYERRKGKFLIDKEIQKLHLMLSEKEYKYKIKTVPVDAEILLNNKKVDKEISLFGDRTYQIEVTHPDYRPYKTEIRNSNSSSNDLMFRLSGKKSTIAMLTPFGTKIYVNNKFIGKSPIRPYEIEPGTYYIRLENQKYSSTGFEVVVRPNENHLIDEKRFNLIENIPKDKNGAPYVYFSVSKEEEKIFPLAISIYNQKKFSTAVSYSYCLSSFKQKFIQFYPQISDVQFCTNFIRSNLKLSRITDESILLEIANILTDDKKGRSFEKRMNEITINYLDLFYKVLSTSNVNQSSLKQITNEDVTDFYRTIYYFNNILGGNYE